PIADTVFIPGATSAGSLSVNFASRPPSVIFLRSITGEPSMSVVWIAIVAAFVVIAFLIVIYNGLVQLRVRADSAWSDIDVQLKRRHDLIPNLVETVKGYAAHEKGTFENVARYRSMAMSATTTSERAEAEGQLTMALKGLLAVAEAY